MGLVSNRPGSIDDEVEELGLKPFFDFCVTSGEVTSWKPDPEIFEHALFLTESSPENTTYVGDNYYTDIIGARNVGIHPILYDPLTIFPDVDCQKIARINDLVSGL